MISEIELENKLRSCGIHNVASGAQYSTSAASQSSNPAWARPAVRSSVITMARRQRSPPTLSQSARLPASPHWSPQCSAFLPHHSTFSPHHSVSSPHCSSLTLSPSHHWSPSRLFRVATRSPSVVFLGSKGSAPKKSKSIHYGAPWTKLVNNHLFVYSAQ